MSEEKIFVALTVDDSQVEEALAKLKQIESGVVSQVSREVGDVQKQAANIIANEGVEIKGVEQAGKRVLRMLPGMREALSIQKGLGQMSTGNVMGVIGLMFLALNLLQQVQRMHEEQIRKRDQFEREIAQARDYSTRAQVGAWETSQKAGFADSRNITR